MCIRDSYNSYNSKLGYVNEKIQLKDDHFITVLSSNQFIDIETNKNKSARLNLNKLDNISSKNILKIDFLTLEEDEYLENCYRLENYIN